MTERGSARPATSFLMRTATSTEHSPEAPFADQSDEELIRMSASGLDAAFEALVRRHGQRVRAYCKNWCGNAARGDELAQQVFIELWRYRHRYRESGHFGAFLFTLVRNRCTSHDRRRKRETAPERTAPKVPDGHLDDLLAGERNRLLTSAISRLSAKLRMTLLLHYGAGLDYEEIARIVGSTPSTVRSRVFLAVCRLRERTREVDI